MSALRTTFAKQDRTDSGERPSVVIRFEDRGISGGTHQRAGYQTMLTAARAHEFDVIVAEDITRLWRNNAEYGPRAAELEDLGIHFVSCVGDDTRHGGWGVMLTIKQAMGEQARREASYRTRRGLEGRALAGQSTGGRAYGYIAARDSGTCRIEIHEEHAAIVRRIFEDYASGVAPRSIAAKLNEEGVPSPGASWKRSERRTDGKRLASAIHGDVSRGTQRTRDGSEALWVGLHIVCHWAQEGWCSAPPAPAASAVS